MTDRLTLAETERMFRTMARTLVEKEPLLTEIDIHTGDGDHGVGMKTGFSAVEQMLLTAGPFSSVKALFQAVGMKLIDSMGGASGVLFGTLFISGISEIKQEDVLTLEDFYRALKKSTEAIMTRGGARPGDKTMIDALVPAVEALGEGVAHGMSFSEAAASAYRAAEKGVEQTKHMVAKRGRAKTFREKTIGYPDAGATSVMLIFEAVAKSAVF